MSTDGDCVGADVGICVGDALLKSDGHISTALDLFDEGWLRDPREANAVSHAGYPKAQQDRHGSELSFEEWTKSFPGRVEEVKAERLYIVKLDKADGEFRLGLVASKGKVLEAADDEENGELAPHIQSLWFERCSAKGAWGANPEFEHYMDGEERIEDALPTESFLLEVEDSDLTDGSVEQKWSKPVADWRSNSGPQLSTIGVSTVESPAFAPCSARNLSRRL